MFDLQEALKNLPDQPGVYIMKDETDAIIYIGKAKILKNRVRQYFHSSRNHSTKIAKMVSYIKEFEYIVTDTELEALILECNLIKKHRPPYNTMLKDDKHYPYIKVTINEAYPRVFMTRKLSKDKAKYFGPYTSVSAVRETLEVVQNIWNLRDCQRRLPKDFGKERPCLNYHIGKCSGPCTGSIDQQVYGEVVDKVINFLNGHHQDVIEQIEKEMMQFAEAMDFEKAAILRDQLNSVKMLTEKQKIINSSMEDQDVIAFARAHDEAMVQVFFIRGGKMIGRENFLLNGVDHLTRNEVMTNFVKQFYSGTPFVPKEIILQEDIDELNIIERWLSDKRGHKVYLKVPQKGEKSKLIDLAAKNAMITLEQFGEKIKREEERTKGAVRDIQNLLEIDEPIQRIEAYDISNTFGYESVGAMVAFEDGKPKRSDYRKFKIKTIIGANDYGSLEEVLRRRFKRALSEIEHMKLSGDAETEGKFSKLPDLILMDGGKGQVSVCQKVLDELNLNIKVCGMVKDDAHRTRGLYYNGQEVAIKKSTEAFKLITRIQDEVHRFAIEYHKSLRWKKQTKSVLDDIPTIGEKRKKALLKHFKSIDKIKTATEDELIVVDGMNKRSVKAILDYFNNK